jgi:tetratricopeptide (TPR) repeat protein
MPLSAGDCLGRYEILEPLGAGGMGEVYRARDQRLGRDVAMKVLLTELSADADRLARFEREATTLAALNHPNIVTIHSVEEAEGVHFLIMELVEGETLAELIPEGGVSLGRFFDLAIPIAEALSAAHGKGVTHRDLKPANVMVTEESWVKVLDFGLAKVAEDDAPDTDSAAGTITAEGRMVGTVPYMSPEQVQGKPADHRSDIFSFGTVLYEMVTGQRPFSGDSSAEVISSILRDTPTAVTDLKAELPRHLGRIIRRCNEKDPMRRYQTALDLSNDLRDLKREIDSGELAVPTAAITKLVSEGRKKVHRTPLVGREGELAELRRLVDLVAGGQGALIMIGGEPGVGKTRLVDELIPEAREQGFLTLVGHCYDTEGTRPFSPWVEILENSARVAKRDILRHLLDETGPEVAKIMPELRRLFPDMPQPVALPPEQERDYLFTSFREYVERSSRVQPLLLVLEDLQWADESTMLLLEHLAQNLGEAPMLIVGTYRDVELDVSRPLGRALRQLVRERLSHRIALKRLPRDGVRDLLKALSDQAPPPRLVDGLFEATEGNPFFVEEVFQHLVEEGQLFDEGGRWRRDVRIEELEVPEGVRLVVGRRLERLSEEARGVLTTAAVIGRRFHFELLEALGDFDPDVLVDAIEEAERLQLISPVSGREIRFHFTQELVRQTLVGGLSSLRRQRLHQRIAEAMERIFAGDLENRASALAGHFYEAGAAADPGKTIHYLILAGRQAQRAAAAEDALRLFEDAISLVSDEDRKARADLLFRRGLALRSLGRWEEALDDWLEALPINEELGETKAAVRICRAMSFQLLWAIRPREAVDIARRGLALVGEDASVDRCRLLATGALGLGQAGDYDSADGMFSEAVAMVEQLGRPPLLGEILGFKAAYHMYFMQFRELDEVGHRAMELLRSAGDLWQLAAAAGHTQSALVSEGRLGAASEIGEEFEPLSRRLGHLGASLLHRSCRGSIDLMRTGDFPAFEESAKAHFDLALRVGSPSVSDAHTRFGLVNLWAGDWEAAREKFEQAVESEGEGVYAGAGWGYLFLYRAYLGDRDAALSMLEERKSPLPRPGQPNTRGAWTMLFGVAEGLAVLDERDKAAKLYPLVLEATAMGIVVRFHAYGLVETVAGIAAAAGEQWEKAEEHYQTALRQAHEIPHKLEQPEVRRWYAQMLIDRDAPGDRDKARTLLEEAIQAYKELGMPKHLEMAEALLAKG